MSLKQLQILLITVVIFFSTCPPLSACTIFNSTEGTRTLVGNNEDYAWNNPSISFLPASGGLYGTMTMSNGGSQGGVNDQGLFYDWNSLPTRSLPLDPFKEDYAGYLAFKILRECANVQEVLVMYERYNEPIFNRAQIQWVDRTGASVICGFGDTGYEYVLKSGPFQVSTNFNLLTDLQYPDSRYNTAVSQLTLWRHFSISKFSNILSQVAQANTIYSNIYDLESGDIYFHCHDSGLDFTTIAKLNLADELAQGAHSHNLVDLTYASKASVLDPFSGSLTPVNNSLTMTPSANLQLAFTENVYNQGLGGYLYIKEYFTDTTFASIPISSVSGLGTMILTVNPANDLTSGETYYVLIDDTCLEDAQGLPYHGMASKYCWRFQVQ
ncbi:MAG: Ig-like domain-containing protein [Acidobacteriota bacterium]